MRTLTEPATKLLAGLAAEINGLGFVGIPVSRAMAMAKCDKTAFAGLVVDLQLAGFVELKVLTANPAVAMFKVTPEGLHFAVVAGEAPHG